MGTFQGLGEGEALQFKNADVAGEYGQLTNATLLRIVDDLAWWVWETLGKPLVITDVFHDTANKKSPHDYGRAVDFRANHDYWTPEEEARIVEFCDQNFPYPRPEYKRIVFHSGGRAGGALTSEREDPNYHGHLQVGWEET